MGLLLSFQFDKARIVLMIFALFIWAATSFLEPAFLRGDGHKKRYIFFKSLTMIAVVLMFLADNFFTYFIFFEIMSFASYVLVAHKGSSGDERTHISYLAYAVLGGMTTLMGLFLLYSHVGSLKYREVFLAAEEGLIPSDQVLIICILIVFGFAVKMGMVPVHTWLVRSYFEALDPVTITLSSVLSKCGVFGALILCLTLGAENEAFGSFLLFFAVLTMFIGGLKGVFSANAKKTLAASSMSQIGFIIAGLAMTSILGAETHIALGGTMLYIINHGLLKLVLFGIVACVFLAYGSYVYNDIRGAGRGNIELMILFAISALAILGLPGLNGYVGKTLIHESILEHAHESGLFYEICEKFFVVSGGLTCAYMLKLFFLLFVDKCSKKKKVRIPVGFRIMLWITTACVVLLGIIPQFTSDTIAGYSTNISFVNEHVHAVEYFSLANIHGAVQSICIGIVIFIIYRFAARRRVAGEVEKIYLDPFAGRPDLETAVYKPVFTRFLPLAGALVARSISTVAVAVPAFFRWIIYRNRSMEFSPNQNESFGSYDKEVRLERLPRGISYSLLLFLLGVGIAFIYIIVRFVF